MRNAVLIGMACLATIAGAQERNCRFYYAAQHSFGESLGFYLDVEGCELASLPMILGVGDGQRWRFIHYVPPFEPGKRYDVRAVITPDNAQLVVDGEVVGESPGGFAPSPNLADVNVTYPWSADLGDYLMIQESVKLAVERDGEVVAGIERDFADEAARPTSLQMFERGAPLLLDLKPQAGDSVIIQTTFRPESYDLVAMSPLIDRFGQHRAGDWPTKVKSEEELVADIEREAAMLADMPPSEDFDQYGGYKKAGWTEQATGFFGVTKRDDYWWLVSPEGNPCFYNGVCAAPTLVWPTTPVSDREFLWEWLPTTNGAWARCWGENLWGVQDGTRYACFYTANLIRKFGPDAWADKATELCIKRLRSWGFHGGGKWGGPPGMVNVPVVGVGKRLVEHMDVFDPEVRAQFREDLEKEIGPRRDDPLVLGWSYGNEYGEIVKRTEIAEIMKMGADVPAKRALIYHAIAERHEGSAPKAAEAWDAQPAVTVEALCEAELELPAEDVELLREFYEDKYYECLYQTFKEVDPNHLYLGNWIVPTWWESEEDWRIHARHVDVIGYDRYAPSYDDELMRRLAAETDKPILCGEYSFPAWYGGQRGFGRFHTNAADDADGGELYKGWMRGAAEDPHCVGMLWFHYRDQAITGRGPGRGVEAFFGEHFAFGLITETDRPKWDMVRAMREANLAAPAQRLAAMEAGR